MEGDQGRRRNHPFPLQFPDQAAVGIVLGIRELHRQGTGRKGTQAPAIKQVEPAHLAKDIQNLMGIAQGQIQGHIAKGRGVRVRLHQPPQPVVTIHHPEVAGLATHQGGGFLAQVPPPLLGAVLGEITLAATDLRHAHTHLGGAQG